jgi:hypothetical protein
MTQCRLLNGHQHLTNYEASDYVIFAIVLLLCFLDLSIFLHTLFQVNMQWKKISE